VVGGGREEAGTTIASRPASGRRTDYVLSMSEEQAPGPLLDNPCPFLAFEPSTEVLSPPEVAKYDYGTPSSSQANQALVHGTYYANYVR